MKSALCAAISRPADAIPAPFELLRKHRFFGAESAGKDSFGTEMWRRSCGAGCVLEAILGEVKQRPPSSKECLEVLGVKFYNGGRVKFASAAGFSALPILDVRGRASAALGMSSFRTADSITAASEHADEDVASTLGGLAKALVLHGDVDGSIAAASEWLGVVSGRAQERAVKAFCSLLKRHGDAATTLNLSKATHGHWREDNFAGKALTKEIFEALWKNQPPGHLKFVFLDGQPKIEGRVLELLLNWKEGGMNGGIPSLRELKLNACPRIEGSIPPSIQLCTNLRVLDIRGCSFTGSSYFVHPPILRESILSFDNHSCSCLPTPRQEPCHFQSCQPH